jgi:hypothetical protein
VVGGLALDSYLINRASLIIITKEWGGNRKMAWQWQANARRALGMSVLPVRGGILFCQYGILR